jgi:hypothetical protein
MTCHQVGYFHTLIHDARKHKPKVKWRISNGILTAEAHVNNWSVVASSKVRNSVYFHWEPGTRNQEPGTHTEVEKPLTMTEERITKRILQYNQEEINTDEERKILKTQVK